MLNCRDVLIEKASLAQLVERPVHEVNGKVTGSVRGRKKPL